MHAGFDDKDDFNEADTSILACDYIRWRLRKEEYDWEECPELPEPNKIRLIMRVLGEDFESRYKSRLDAMVLEMDITPQNGFPSFMGICHYIIENTQISWGQIIAVFAFGGALAVHCLQNGLPQLIGNIADWIAVLCDSKFSNFVQGNEGWVSCFIYIVYDNEIEKIIYRMD